MDPNNNNSDFDIANQRFEVAKAQLGNDLITLEFTGLQLTESQLTDFLSRIPEEIPELKVLDLSAMQLDRLPTEIALLRSLECLRVENNKLTGLPEEVGALPLIALLAGSNQFESFPEVLLGMSSLRILGLEDNKIVAMPDRMTNLKDLDTLRLFENQIEWMPGVGDLESISDLALSNNAFTRLPNVRYLDNLQTLTLNNNKLQYEENDYHELFNRRFIKNVNATEYGRIRLTVHLEGNFFNQQVVTNLSNAASDTGVIHLGNQRQPGTFNRLGGTATNAHQGGAAAAAASPQSTSNTRSRNRRRGGPGRG